MVRQLDSAQAAERQDETRVLDLRIRCMSEKDREWFAECLDLDLLAQRPSPPAALRALMEQVQLYLESAAELDKWDQLVPRPAPPSHWVAYYLASVLHEVRRVLRLANLSPTFRMPVDRRGHCLCT